MENEPRRPGPIWMILKTKFVDQIIPFWTILDILDRFGRGVDHSELFWTILNGFCTCCNSLDHCGPFWTILDQI